MFKKLDDLLNKHAENILNVCLMILLVGLGLIFVGAIIMMITWLLETL